MAKNDVPEQVDIREWKRGVPCVDEAHVDNISLPLALKINELRRWMKLHDNWHKAHSDPYP